MNIISKAIVTLIFILIHYYINSQDRIPIIPEQVINFGGHDHTSRDQLVQMELDRDGNLLLLGFVEGDSIFADGVLQKISTNGQLIWEYAFDSKSINNYDIPQRMDLDSAGNVTALILSYGLAYFFELQRSSTYILKVDKQGQLVWRHDLDTLLPTHTSTTHLDGFLDSEGYYNVSCSIYQDLGVAPTYFLRFDPDGNLVYSFIKEGIEQALISTRPSAYTEGVDSTGNFVYSIFDENVLPHRYLRKINPVTSVDQIFPFDTSALTQQEKFYFDYLEWNNISIDANGAIVSATNFPFPLPGVMHMGRMEADGKLNYVIRTDSLGAHFAVIQPWNDHAVVTGTYYPHFGDPSVSYLWMYDKNGNRVNELIEDLANPSAPRFLKVTKDHIYWATMDLSARKVRIKDINPIDFSVNWEYVPAYPVEYDFTGVNIIPLPDSTYTLGATLWKEKQPGSGLLCEQEYYIESFSPSENLLISNAVYNHAGTTLTEIVLFRRDHTGNYYVLTQELDGAEDPQGYFAPRIWYYHKFSPDWQPIWTIPSKGLYHYAFNLDPFYFDSEDNIYVVEFENNGPYFLRKISSQGIYLEEYPIIESVFHKIVIDRMDNVHLSIMANNSDLKYLVLDKHLQTLGHELNGLLLISVFQLPGQDDVYTYFVDQGTDPGEQDIKVVLQKNYFQLWQRIFNFIGNPVSFSKYSVDPGSGDMIAYSGWEQLELHKFSIANQYSHIPLYHQTNELVNEITLMSNGNSIIAFDDRLDIYDAGLSIKKSVDIDSVPPGGYYFRDGDLYYKSQFGSLDCFTDDGDFLYGVEHESFAWEPTALEVTATGKITTTDIYGEQWEKAGLEYGWFRGNVQVFDISDLISTVKPEVKEDYHGLQSFPNPAQDEIHIMLPNEIQYPVEISFYSFLGTKCKSVLLACHSDVKMNISTLPNGPYLWIAKNESGKMTGNFVVFHK
jgi:hypothetical protein